MVSSKSTKSPAFQLYAAEFLSGEKVCRMSYAEIGMFTCLLCHAWLGHGLPPRVPEIAKLLKLNPKRFEVQWRGVLSECWIERGGKLVNPKQEKIRQNSAAYSKKQSDRAAKGWQSRGNAAAVHKPHPSGNALQSSSSSSTSSSKKEKATTTSSLSRGLLKPHGNVAFDSPRVWVPWKLHLELVGLRNNPNAETELQTFYQQTSEAWTAGPHGADNVDPEMFNFWRARYAEQWPPPAPTRDSKQPAWIAAARAKS